MTHMLIMSGRYVLSQLCSSRIPVTTTTKTIDHILLLFLPTIRAFSTMNNGQMSSVIRLRHKNLVALSALVHLTSVMRALHVSAKRVSTIIYRVLLLINWAQRTRVFPVHPAPVSRQIGMTREPTVTIFAGMWMMHEFVFPSTSRSMQLSASPALQMTNKTMSF